MLRLFSPIYLLLINPLYQYCDFLFYQHFKHFPQFFTYLLLIMLPFIADAQLPALQFLLILAELFHLLGLILAILRFFPDLFIFTILLPLPLPMLLIRLLINVSHLLFYFYDA